MYEKRRISLFPRSIPNKEHIFQNTPDFRNSTLCWRRVQNKQNYATQLFIMHSFFIAN